MALLPFAAVLVGMLTGRVRARACCAVPVEQDARLRDPVDDLGALQKPKSRKQVADVSAKPDLQA